MRGFNTYIDSLDYSEIKDFFIQRGQKQICCRKDFFMRQNELSCCAAFVEEGIFHYTRIDDNGNEHIVGYSFAGEFMCDYSSFIKRGSSLVSIKALTNCTIYTITLNDYLEYCNSKEDGRQFRYMLAETFFEEIYKRLLAHYCDSPEQAYIKLMQRCSYLKEIVPLKEIASFLGVTPETVSHIRRKLRQK